MVRSFLTPRNADYAAPSRALSPLLTTHQNAAHAPTRARHDEICDAHHIQFPKDSFQNPCTTRSCARTRPDRAADRLLWQWWRLWVPESTSSMLLLPGESTYARSMQPPTPLRPVRRSQRRRAAHPRGETSGADRTSLTSDHGETATFSLSISAARHDSAANGIANKE